MSLSYANIHIYNPVQGLPAHPNTRNTEHAVPVHTELAHIGGDVGMGDLKR